MQKHPQPKGIADYILQSGKRKIKNDFFEQINRLIDWKPIEEIIQKHYNKGHKKTGRPLKPKGRKQIELTDETDNNPINMENSSVKEAIAEEQATPQKTISYKKYVPCVDQETYRMFL